MSERDTTEQEREGVEDEPLLAFLRELIRTQGREQTADLLGVSVRTLFRTVASGRLTARMRDTLELQLVGNGSEPDQRRGTDGAELERRVERLEERVGALVGGSRKAPTRALAPREGTEAGQHAAVQEDAGARAATVKGGPQPVIGKPAVSKPWRPYPQLVTLEAEAGEELIYDEATPLIEEWRRARIDHIDSRKSRVEQATAWVGMRELELVLIGEHELTLPPQHYPWNPMERGREVWKREQSLRDARWERRRALFWRWLRRLLTLGLWRK